MIINKQEYTEKIKPAIDNLYKLAKNLNTSEQVIIGDAIIKITKTEFDFSNLLKEFNKLTPLQIDFLKKKEIYNEIETATQFLSEKFN